MDEYMNSGIYKITNLKNGKFYIGSSKNIPNRWSEHVESLNKGNHSNTKLQNAWNFYGKDVFKFDIIEIVKDVTILLEREQHYLSTFLPHVGNVGYNICPSAYGGDNFTFNPNKENIREKLSEMYSGENNPMFGRNHSEESILKQKEKSQGRFSIEWFIERNGKEKGERLYNERRNFLKNRNINYSYPNNCKGKIKGPLSNEHKNRISDTKLRMKSIKTDLVNDIKNGELSSVQIQKKYGISKQSVLYHKSKIRSIQPS